MALSQADVDNIEKMFEEGVKVSAICERYDISDTVAYKIKNREHGLQKQADLRQRQLHSPVTCPACGRPLISPCKVCQIRRNLVEVGEFSKLEAPHGAR